MLLLQFDLSEAGIIAGPLIETKYRCVTSITEHHRFESLVGARSDRKHGHIVIDRALEFSVLAQLGYVALRVVTPIDRKINLA